MGLFDSVLKGLGFESQNNSGSRMIIKPRDISSKTKPKRGYERFNLHNKTSEGSEVVADLKRAHKTEVKSSDLIIYAPKSHEDVQMVVECLKREDACLVNLEEINEEDTSRVLDFLSGAIFALDGQITRLQGHLFLIAPENVNIKRGD